MVGEPKPEHPLHGDPNRDSSRLGPHPHRPPISRRQLLLQTVVAGVILISGVGIGAGGTILALRGRIIPKIRAMPLDPPGPEPNAIAARWKGKYGLSDKQEQQAKDIVAKQFATLRDTRQKLFQAEQSEREKAAVSLKKVFNSEQYAQWDQDMKRMAERFENMRARGPRGDHKGPPRGERGPGRPRDPNDHRWDGPPRPSMEGEGRGGWPPRPPMERGSRRGTWPPREPMDANNPSRDRPPEQPMAAVSAPPGEANAPK